MKVYGIKNCDSVKKARRALDADNIGYTFIDLKTAELTSAQVGEWLSQCPDTLINKRSTTYRQIKAQWLAAADSDAQIALIIAHPTLIKRPLIEGDDGKVSVGWS